MVRCGHREWWLRSNSRGGCVSRVSSSDHESLWRRHRGRGSMELDGAGQRWVAVPQQVARSCFYGGWAADLPERSGSREHDLGWASQYWERKTATQSTRRGNRYDRPLTRGGWPLHDCLRLLSEAVTGRQRRQRSRVSQSLGCEQPQRGGAQQCRCCCVLCARLRRDRTSCQPGIRGCSRLRADSRASAHSHRGAELIGRVSRRLRRLRAVVCARGGGRQRSDGREAFLHTHFSGPSRHRRNPTRFPQPAAGIQGTDQLPRQCSGVRERLLTAAPPRVARPAGRMTSVGEAVQMH